MDRAFITVLHLCFFTPKKLQSVLNYADLPLNISYCRLLCKMLFRINVTIKKRKTHRWGGDLMFYLCFCYNARMHVVENVQQRPLGSRFSVGRRIRCNTPPSSSRCIEISYRVFHCCNPQPVCINAKCIFTTLLVLTVVAIVCGTSACMVSS